jgi:uncharacterized membrane protein
LIHRLLIPFPLGLLATSFFFDLAWILFRKNELSTTAWWLIAGGVVTAIAAAIPGMSDYRKIPGESRAKSIGMLHGIGNLCVVVLFTASWLIRRDEPGQPEVLAIVLSGTAVALSIATGWLGAQLADRLAVSASTAH